MTADHSRGRPRAARFQSAGIIFAIACIAGPMAAGCAGSPAASVVGTPAVTLPLVAQGNRFDQSSLSVSAGSPFAIIFDNRDSVPHNVSVRGGSTPLTAPLTTEIFGGPDQRTYTYPALPAGTYTFICDVHPAEMTGALTAS